MERNGLQWRNTLRSGEHTAVTVTIMASVVLGMGERLWSGLAGLTVGSDSMPAPCIWQLILGLTAHLISLFLPCSVSSERLLCFQWSLGPVTEWRQ